MSTNGQGTLFEYAVVYHPRPTKEQHERNETPKSVLLVEPRRELAGTQEEIGMLAARAIPPEHLEHLADIEILVRPF